MVKNEVSLEKIEDICKNIRENAKECGKNMSENYKQKLIYNLLNALKANDQEKFLWLLLRALNALSSDEYRPLITSINEGFSLPQTIFEKWGYSIVLGLMAGGQESKQEVSENE